MAMYLANVPTFAIMMIGRWSSDVFLKYIRKQVEQFSHNVPRRMIGNEDFFTTPNFEPTVSRHDTRTRNDPFVFATREREWRGSTIQSEVRAPSLTLKLIVE